MHVLLIDNHDSYTWNLAHQIARVTGKLPDVVLHDAIDLDEIRAMRPDAIVLSPGPGRPEHASDLGVCDALLRHWDGRLLGVCLGHQGLGWVHGARIVRSPRQLHGRLSKIRHDGRGLFVALPQNFDVVRYHSLAVTGPIPKPLVASAWSDDGVIMGLRHTEAPHVGVQFHPESVCTQFGDALMANFLRPTRPVAIAPQKVSATPCTHHSLRVRRLDHAANCTAAFDSLMKGRPGAFWLDSSGGVSADTARFSYMGACDGPSGRLVSWRRGGPVRVQSAHETPDNSDEGLLTTLRDQLRRMRCDSELPFDFVGGWVGWLGYEARALFAQPTEFAGDTADAMFGLCDRLVVVDHKLGHTWLVAIIPDALPHQADAWMSATAAALDHLPQPQPRRTTRTTPFSPSKGRAAYVDAVEQAKDRIAHGESYEVCLTHQLVGGPIAEPFDAYQQLRRANPAPYSAYLSFGDVHVLCSSPEQFLKVDRQGRVSTRPIKGTRARHADPTKDRESAVALSASEKDRAENLMIVDLMRNDLGRVCHPDSVRAPSMMQVETFATVHHLVSTVTGDMRPEFDVLDVVASAFPPGSMTGAPKVRTMQIIEELEQQARGIYSGTIGFLSVNGTSDLNVVIRTAICTDHRTTIGAGGAVVGLSDAQDEWKEAQIKAQALLSALEHTQCGSPDQPRHSSPVTR